MIVLLGTRVDEKTLKSLGIKDWEKIVENLANMGYLYSFNNCIYFPNDGILKKCLLEVIKSEDLQSVANDLFNLIYVDSMPNPVKAYLHDLSGSTQKIISEWEKLANINLSMGDFTSYLNCSTEILKSLDKYASSWSEDELVKYKMSLYENVSNTVGGSTKYYFENGKSIDVVWNYDEDVEKQEEYVFAVLGRAQAIYDKYLKK
jgi:hypothetical protein